MKVVSFMIDDESGVVKKIVGHAVVPELLNIAITAIQFADGELRERTCRCETCERLRGIVAKHLAIVESNFDGETPVEMVPEQGGARGN